MNFVKILLFIIASMAIPGARAQGTVTFYLKDGTTHLFSVQDIESITHEPWEPTETYEVNGRIYPMPTAVSGMTPNGLKWANLDVGAMNEKNCGLIIHPSQINDIVASIGNGWRVPTREEFEELLNIDSNRTLLNIQLPDKLIFTGKNEKFLYKAYIASSYSDERLPIAYSLDIYAAGGAWFWYRHSETEFGTVSMDTNNGITEVRFNEPKDVILDSHTIWKLRLVKD